MKVLILGAGGMLGHMMLRELGASRDLTVIGTVRAPVPALTDFGRVALCTGVDALDTGGLSALMAEVRPDVVLNCVGLVKQHMAACDPLPALQVNAVLPHQLARLCQQVGARLIHFSTDCVFSGARGTYRESDPCDPVDLYGRTKLLGEVANDPAVLTLRVSFVGPELGTTHGLLAWFLAQHQAVRGFRHAIFSGFTSLELARIVRDRLLARPDLHGVYHLSADPISKLDFLSLAGRIYGHAIPIEPCDQPVIDRSLDSTRLREALGYRPPSWQDMLTDLHTLERYD